MDSITNVCRLCLNTENLSWVFNRKLYCADLEDVIFTTIGVEISIDDIISQQICAKCLQTTIKMYEIGRKFRRRNNILEEPYKKKFKPSSIEHAIADAGVKIKKQEPSMETKENEVSHYKIHQSVGDLILNSLSTCVKSECNKCIIMEVDTVKNSLKGDINDKQNCFRLPKPENRVSEKNISTTKKNSGSDCFNMEIIQENSIVSEILKEYSSSVNHSESSQHEFTFETAQWSLYDGDKMEVDTMENFSKKEKKNEHKRVRLSELESIICKKSTSALSTATGSHLSSLYFMNDQENYCFDKQITQKNYSISEILNQSLICDSDYESEGIDEFTMPRQWRLSDLDFERKMDTKEYIIKKENENEQNCLRLSKSGYIVCTETTPVSSTAIDSLRFSSLPAVNIEENRETDCFKNEIIHKNFTVSDIVNENVSIGDSDYESDGIDEFPIKPMKLSDKNIMRKMNTAEIVLKKEDKSEQKCAVFSVQENSISTKSTSKSSTETDSSHSSSLSFMNVEENSVNYCFEKKIIQKNSVVSDVIKENLNSGDNDYYSDSIDELTVKPMMHRRLSDYDLRTKVDNVENIVKKENESTQKCVGLSKRVKRISSSIVKPDIRINNSTVLDNFDPKLTDIEIVKILLTKPTEFNLEKSSQTELLTGKSIYVNGRSGNVEFKCLRNVLNSYEIPILIKEGHFQVRYIYCPSNFKPRQPKQLWNDLVPIDVKIYESSNNEVSGQDRISAVTPKVTTKNLPTTVITSNFFGTKTYLSNPSFAAVSNQRTHNNNSSFPTEVDLFTRLLDVPVHPFNTTNTAEQPFNTNAVNPFSPSNVQMYHQSTNPSVRSNNGVANKILVPKNPTSIRLAANIAKMQATPISHPNSMRCPPNVNPFCFPNLTVPKTSPMVSRNLMNNTLNVNNSYSPIHNLQNYLVVQNKVPNTAHNLVPNRTASDSTKAGSVYGSIRVKSLWELK